MKLTVKLRVGQRILPRPLQLFQRGDQRFRDVAPPKRPKVAELIGGRDEGFHAVMIPRRTELVAEVYRRDMLHEPDVVLRLDSSRAGAVVENLRLDLWHECQIHLD